ncbi:MAG: nucleotidyltransferase [Lachnospiraceae bacterium]|nr:nucleotidyltransferase [Lachnospiraceae bacterium]
MKTVGIIAEYNPFHNGHFYQLQKAKELSGADFAVVVMSGNFVQRGTPALIDKYARTKMALCNGADLVLELPVCYATASAEYFAKGAVSLLSALGVDALCFGSECGDVSVLQTIAQILSDEPDAFKAALEKNLQLGVSFPVARSRALREYIAFSTDLLCKKDLACKENLSHKEELSLTEPEVLTKILESPNNILGIEYIKTLISLHSSMEVYTVRRTGSDYSDTTLPDHTFSSAMAIRQSIFEGSSLDTLSSYMPKDSLHILKEALSDGFPVCENDFSGMLFYKLLSLQNKDYTSYLDVSPSLSDKISGLLEQYTSWSQFCSLLKSKDLTHTRISRSLLHILLDIKKNDLQEYRLSGYSGYARILGFKKSSQALFGTLKTASIPLLSKLADADKLLSDTAKKQLAQDIFAAHLYDGTVAQKTGRTLQNEYRRQIVIL